MLSEQDWHAPLIRALRILLREQCDSLAPPAYYECALNALASALLLLPNGSAQPWVVKAVPDTTLWFEVTPLQYEAMRDSDLLVMMDALRSQPEIASVDPLYIRMLL